MEITTIGVDLAKNVFQVHGVDQRGKVALRSKRGTTSWSSSSPSYAVPGRHGSLRQRAPLGARLQGQGHSVRADRLAVRQALRQEQQERCGGGGW